MGNILLLDCTLRDGGYVNDWNFGQSNLISVFERLVTSGVDIIEIGFLDQRRQYDPRRSIMPDTACAKKLYGSVEKCGAMVVGMIDYGTCVIENLQPCAESFLDGIRVIFKKEMMYEAIGFCRQVKALGYQVFIQAVSITSYSDKELKAFVDLVNDLKPYALSMVDTYGLLHKGNLLHYFKLMDRHLLPEIGLGYHSHNNFQLAYANCIEVLKTKTQRTIVVDATLYGMGKSAGNAPIELLAMHMNSEYGKCYILNQMLEAIDSSIMNFYRESPWGYNLFYFLAASNACHPSYVQFLMDKHTLSVKSINQMLDQIEPEMKLLYNQKHIEALYFEYQKRLYDDTKAKKQLRDLFAGHELLILGPGKTIASEKERILSFIQNKSPIVLAINFIPEEIQPDYVFLSNPRRYIRLTATLKRPENAGVKLIATSNVTHTVSDFDFVLNSEPLLDQDAEVVDNSFIMLLKALRELLVMHVVCAGLDGYAKEGGSYADETMEYWFARRKADNINAYVRKFLEENHRDIQVVFLTDTRYLEHL